ncbi:MAG TPA: Hsp20/alpha crystallin family protein, partial [Thermomicrobiaceae bacterium]|nr:Hsp20/alpha crystallin family protein [Thermomicrobiaceae bacterium]
TYGYSVSPEIAKQATWHCREVVSGEFTDSVTVPATVDPAKVSASFENGILTLTLQKTPDTQAHRIPVIPAKAGH